MIQYYPYLTKLELPYRLSIHFKYNKTKARFNFQQKLVTGLPAGMNHQFNKFKKCALYWHQQYVHKYNGKR